MGAPMLRQPALSATRSKSTSTLGHEERRLAGSKAVLRAGVGRPNVERGSKERGRGAEVAHLGGARATVG